MNIIVYCSFEWIYFNRREFFIELAKANPNWNVIVINRPFSLIPNLLRYRKIVDFFSRSADTDLPSNLLLVRPITLTHDILDISRIPLFGWLNYRMIRHSIRGLLSRGLNVAWVYDTVHCGIAHFFKRDGFSIVWEIYDDYRFTHEGRERPKYINCDADMVGVADIIFTLTSGLKKEYENRHSKVFVMGNGYSEAIFNLSVVPKGLDCFGSPVVLYLGIIRDWIDFEKYEQVISLAPDLVFLFVGPIESDVEYAMKRLLDYPNVFHTNRVSREEAAQYMKAADVGLIIYKENTFTRNVRPIKVIEMMAVGTPVLSTCLADYKEVEGNIQSISGLDAVDIIGLLRSTLISANSAGTASIAENHTWSRVAVKVKNIIVDENAR